VDGKKVLEIYQKMVSDRGNMGDLWKEVVHYCFPAERPEYSTFGGNTTTRGQRRTNPVCSYPVVFTQRLGSSIHSNAFPANDYWFDFAIIGEKGETSEESRVWCRQARDVVHRKIRQGTNFYQESHAMMVGLAAFGTAGFYTYYKAGRLHFRYIPIHKNFYIESNSDGEIDTVALLHEWTAKEAIEEYGAENVGAQVLSAFKAGVDSGTRYSYVQLIYPKKVYGEAYSPKKGGKPYGDITVELDGGRVVKEEQLSGFPFAIPRFMVYSDDLYGRSPAMAAMPDIKAANALRKALLDASVRAVNPPMFINSLMGNINTAAGAVNKIAGVDKNSVWTYPVPTDFPAGKELMADLLESLKQAFYIDVFQAIEQQKYMTATEVTERVRQKVESISPIVTRLQKEFSSRVVLRCLNLLIEHGDLEPPPSKVGGKNASLKVAYISSLDAMMQQGVAAKTMNFVNQLNLLGQTVTQLPDLATILNTDAIVQALGDANTLPSEFFRKKEEVEAIRQANAMQQQAIAQADVESKQAASLADLAKANGGALPDQFMEQMAEQTAAGNM